MVHEVLTDAFDAHRGDVHVAPDIFPRDILLGDVDADAVDALTGRRRLDDRVGGDPCELICG